MAQNRLEMKVPSILPADRYERGGVMIKSNLPLFRHIFKDLMVAARASPIAELSIGSYQMEAGMKNWQRALNEWILIYGLDRDR